MLSKIEEIKRWSADSVRKVCIENNLYTAGDNEEYGHMLDWVGRLYPNTENIYFIADDIYRHSENQTISNIMFVLANYAVITCYEIDGDDNR